MQHLQQLYTHQFSPLFSANEGLTPLKPLNELAGADAEADVDQALSAFKAEIGKYERIGADVAEKAHLRLRMSTEFIVSFPVECFLLVGCFLN